jgi:phosphonate transport system substrate-binding protein
VRPWEYQPLFAVSPSNALIGAYFGQADAAGVESAVPWAPKVQQMIDLGATQVIAQSKPVLQLPWAVRSDMAPELREKIQGLLAHLGTTEKGKHLLQQAGLTGLIPVSDRDYDPHRRIVARVLGESY